MDLTHRARQLVVTMALAGVVTAGTATVAVAAEGDATAPAPAETHHPRRALRHAVGRIVADTLGVDRAELRDALRRGQSVAEYAASLGKAPQTVVDALVAAVNEYADQAVQRGRITEERAAAIAEKAPERAETLVHRHFEPGRPGW